MKRHIVLIGLPGAGKTTVGRMVAERLHAGFVDIDNVLIRKERRKITRILRLSEVARRSGSRPRRALGNPARFDG